jgi:hypothetical protein
MFPDSVNIGLRCLAFRTIRRTTTFDLRCNVREGMLAFIKHEMPEAIVGYRGEMTRCESEAVMA